MINALYLSGTIDGAGTQKTYTKRNGVLITSFKMVHQDPNGKTPLVIVVKVFNQELANWAASELQPGDEVVAIGLLKRELWVGNDGIDKALMCLHAQRIDLLSRASDFDDVV